MAKKKFDTNPLDPDFPKQAAFEPQPQETQTLPNNGAAATQIFEEPAPTEENATRKFDEANYNAYQSPYNGQNVPSPYQPPHPLYAQNDRTRKVAKIGLPENVLTVLPYIPFHIGLIAGIIELFIVPKSEAKVRFHAAQGVAAHLAIIIISWILHSIGSLTGAEFGNTIFGIVTTVMLIIFAIKAFQGKPIHIEAVDDLTNWLEDKIKPSE
ncbi:MAG TPA: hypothetical protein VNB22_22295 [Pyrinomonadaceae bacterium]|jgi:uncharacterized membrane protein|nr:hypothetical protein [Pyrinomonadaceae bacterium]